MRVRQIFFSLTKNLLFAIFSLLLTTRLAICRTVKEDFVFPYGIDVVVVAVNAAVVVVVVVVILKSTSDQQYDTSWDSRRKKKGLKNF